MTLKCAHSCNGHVEGNEYELQYPIGRRVGSVTGLVYMRRILMSMYCRRVIVTRPLGQNVSLVSHFQLSCATLNAFTWDIGLVYAE